ncbi:hypothetical protein A9Q73_01220 [Bermanella sp. 47_1433_sub80_T6]|nr:hypothetical protein A9Q73_01220 [Bermanella sp. 47_1433_sub80_T6]
MDKSLTRRTFLSYALQQGPVLAVGASFMQLSTLSHAKGFRVAGPLQAADANGIRLPKGFKSRIVAVSGIKVLNSQYEWHQSPDGGACFAQGDGWVYVSNSEEYFPDGGVGAISFDGQGNIKDAYSILDNTVGNCAGGATPWHTWLSCEEVNCGAVYETDPFGKKAAIKRPALGYFKHEAVAVDSDGGQLYLTEDEKDGCLYRFTPSKPLPDLTAGVLEVAVVDAQQRVSWQAITEPNPWNTALSTRTRYQVKEATQFRGGEGIWYQKGLIIFSTKRDDRIWVLDIAAQTIKVLYDAKQHQPAILSGVDNVTVSPSGDILVAEDGGDMQLVLLDANGSPTPLLQVTGQTDSELTGPAFSPDGQRLYFSSQRGQDSEQRLGITYEISRL